MSKCRKLELVELSDSSAVTELGFAQLLRSNVGLASLGRCDVAGKVMEALYGEQSVYKRC